MNIDGRLLDDVCRRDYRARLLEAIVGREVPKGYGKEGYSKSW